MQLAYVLPWLEGFQEMTTGFGFRDKAMSEGRNDGRERLSDLLEKGRGCKEYCRSYN